jgi:hypothetical protein
MKTFLFCAALLFSVNAQALNLSGISNQEAASGLKETLTQAASMAVSKLGVADGFLKNDKVRIPLPDSLQTVKRGMALMGKSKDFDELEVGINRAAEAAVPKAKQLLVNAVKGMSVQDAKGILSGGDNAVTEFFRSKTEASLAQQFLPIVKATTDKSGLAQKYNSLAGQGASFGVVKQEDSKIENYVTRKTLDGLFLMLGEEEKAIRKDPVGTGSALLKKILAQSASRRLTQGTKPPISRQPLALPHPVIPAWVWRESSGLLPRKAGLVCSQE